MSFLDKAMIVAPCSVSWDTMEGDERVRHCSGCSKNVYNLSDMNAGEAEIFLGQNGERPCLRFYRRPDGKIMTDNCPRALRALRNRMRKVVAIAAGVFLQKPAASGRFHESFADGVVVRFGRQRSAG